MVYEVRTLITGTDLNTCSSIKSRFCTMTFMEPVLKKQKMENNLQESQETSDIPSSEAMAEIFDSPDPFAEFSSTKIDSSPENFGLKHEPKEENNVQVEDKKICPLDECGGGESSRKALEPEPPFWKGSPLSELQKGRNHYGLPQMHPIKPSSNHTVVFQMGPVKKEISNTPTDVWDNNHVKMPCSPQNKYPAGDTIKSHWQMIKTALEKPIASSYELEEVIMSYNYKYMDRWDFAGLHYFCNEIIEEVEREHFFKDLLPQIAELALQLPKLITRPLPLLRQNNSHSISLTQQQVACLLANAFFCTFPRRNAVKKNSEYANFPDINFNRLFQGQKKKSVLQRTTEKLKCIVHYFRRVCVKPPKGNITFSRRYIPSGGFPYWESSGHYFRKLHISSQGTIETSGKGMVQVDFANKMIGGGVLGWGCVQEEIRFVICPELIVARLFTESLGSTEALIIAGCEQYSVYSGYADNFTWVGDYIDSTPRDCSDRLLTTIVGIDALYLRYPAQQFTTSNMMRELNKAYCGFFNSEINPDNLTAIATGNWGCGVYRGNAHLKALLQLMAASQCGRAVAYFTFGDNELRDDVAQMHKFLVDHKATVGLVWRHLSKYYDMCYRNGSFSSELYDYLCKAIDSTYCKKGRLSAIQFHSKMKSSCTLKVKPSEASRLKLTCDSKGITSPSTSHEKSTISKISLPSVATTKIHLLNAGVNQTRSATAPSNKTRTSTELNVVSETKHAQTVEKKDDVNPFKVNYPPATEKTKSPDSPSKKLWRKNIPSQPGGAEAGTGAISVKGKTAISTVKHSPRRKEIPKKISSSKNKFPPDAFLQNTDDDYGIDDYIDVGEGVDVIENENEEYGSDPPGDLSRRPHCLTIQKRISDYFYEINVPK